MAEEMKVEIIGKETIKPSSPTPSHLKIFNLSFLDQIIPAVYTSLVLFYPNNINIITSGQISDHLKKSLSEALTLFYPLAGRVKDNTVIECRDDGAQYVEAKFNGLLSTFLGQQHKDEALIRQFLPAEIESREAGTWPLWLVQATFFNCGGVAIGICVSHKLADAATLSIVLKTLAGTAVPDFEAAASYYCPGDTFSFAPAPATELKRVEGVAKRYVFDKSKIAALKAKFASDSVKQPTRVEVVTALVFRCLMEASISTTGSSTDPVKPRYSHLTQAANIRNRVEPPFSPNSVGNLVAYIALQAENETYENSSEPLEHQLQDLVAKLRQGIEDFTENKAKRFRGEDGFRAVVEYLGELQLNSRNDMQYFVFTSWCNFGFYEVDLGLGKPICVTVPSSSYENAIILTDTIDGDGVEILLTLSKENMALFENHLERFLHYLLVH
ncbi:Salutaridinol 7-O-acetyltransferase [Morus notabilis]|uniref:Salutaridinol 7-O-acetyltransferase n=1 Tax=Morus notabilis TaxID=981085 RepID=W9RC93_9ROSA|nr:Salutaridinol 7-O-acetyltransferase [Morus notabilis]